MIYLAWALNLFLALLIGTLIRKLISNIFLKRFFYASFLSLFVTLWFLYPGSQDLAPVTSIYFIELLESENLFQMRLLRPTILVFFMILIFDFLLFQYKSKKK
tara:strand:+ start:202 stop:510 length:309 start_codon:yes stop_codon:yes gene_type:complete